MSTEDRQHQEFQLRDYWQVLVRRRWIVATCVIVTTLAAAVSSLVATPVYKSTARISIERTGVRLLRQNLSSAEPSWIDYQNFYNTQYQVLSSDAVLRRVVENLDLPNRGVPGQDSAGEDEGSLLAKLSALKGNLIKTFTRGDHEVEAEADPLEPYLEVLRGGISVDPVRDSHLVNVSFISPDREFAQEVANEIFVGYRDFSLSAKIELANASQEFFAERIEELRAELVTLEGDVQEYARSEGIVIGDSKDTAREDLVDLRKQLTTAKTEVADKEAALEAVLRTPPESLREVRDNPSIQRMRNEAAAADREYQQKLATLGSDYPAVRQAKANLDTARDRLQTEIDGIAKQIVDSARADARRARSNESRLQTLFNQSRDRVEGQQTAIAEYETLRSMATRKRATLEDLVTRRNDMMVSANLGEVEHNVRMIDEARLPRIIHSPKKKLNIMLGFFFGLFLGIGTAVLIEFIDNTLKTPDDVRNVLGKSVLGMIPAHEANGRTRRGKSKRRGPSGPVVTEPALITYRAPSSPIAESYRELRTSLLLATPGHPPREIAVTSCQPSEGKTTTAINLATALAQLDKKVLLVDCDLRRPRCHQVLKVSASRGVSNYLSGLSELGDLLQPTPIEGLTLLPAGPIPPNPAEMLDSSRYQQFVRELKAREDFDHIIFDSPPALSVVDPLLIARHTEGLVLVIRSAFTSREAGRLGLEKLAAGRVHLLGIVLNAVELDHVPYQYRYYRYGYAQEKGGQRSRSRKQDRKVGAGSA